MPEIIDNQIEPDFDEWLSGGERKAHFVTLYGRADLYADIEELERQRVVAQEVAEEDRSMAGDDDPNAELDEKINALWLQLDQSKREFRVSARTEPELAVIREEVTKDLKDAADSAAAKARGDAKELAKRIGLTAVNDVNNMLRGKALEASNKVIEREISVRAIADSTTMRRNGEWVPMTHAQVRALHDKLGESQVDALNRAYSRAANEAPAVNLPK